MHWGETEAPVWLKYVGRLADGDLDANGNSVELRGPLSLALNGRGTALYVASPLGMQVFEHDVETGGLTLVQSLEDYDLEDYTLIWDAHRTKLYAHRCGMWRKFAPVDGTHRELRDKGMLTVTGSPGIHRLHRPKRRFPGFREDRSYIRSILSWVSCRSLPSIRRALSGMYRP